LAQISNLHVISRTALQRFTRSATPIEEVSRAFDVDAVMEGTVKYQGGRVRISIQLVDPGSGIQLWSNTYERDFSDIFENYGQLSPTRSAAETPPSERNQTHSYQTPVLFWSNPYKRTALGDWAFALHAEWHVDPQEYLMEQNPGWHNRGS
jgi:hypothetical protein